MAWNKSAENRKIVGQKLLQTASPSKMWHKQLHKLDVKDFESSYLKDMGKSKNVYKTTKSEAEKSSFTDTNLVESIMKLKHHYDRCSKK